MKLGELIDVIERKKAINKGEVEVNGITSDSRLVRKGNVFVAVRGWQRDGHEFINQALERGAIACVTETAVDIGKVPNIVVDDSAKALAVLASKFYGDPSRSLWMCGITGTNGKTSTAHMLRSIYEESSWGKAGVIGTVGHGQAGDLERAQHTTPDAVKLHALIKDIKEKSCRGVVMEVSSHAVRQQRTWGIEFDLGILTNVTRDHLDYHKTLDDYINAKREFCMSLVSEKRAKRKGTLVYFLDDEVAERIGGNFPGQSISVGLSDRADVYADETRATLESTEFKLHLGKEGSKSISLKLLGSFSVQNALLAAAAALVSGVDINGIKRGLEALESVPGRFEALGGKGKPIVIVDYCHTPDSLERALEFCLDLNPSRLITVFGCGGDRDKGKRPIMGEIAQRLSNVCYVTSDNPRTEDAGRIIEDILLGMNKSDKDLFVEVDRKRAIKKAIKNAGMNDLIAICGKGHEDYQIIGEERLHFSDSEEAEKALTEWGQH